MIFQFQVLIRYDGDSFSHSRDTFEVLRDWFECSRDAFEHFRDCFDPKTRLKSSEMPLNDSEPRFITPKIGSGPSEIDLNASMIDSGSSMIDFLPSETVILSSEIDFLCSKIVFTSIEVSPNAPIPSLSGTLRFSYRTGVHPKKTQRAFQPFTPQLTVASICAFNIDCLDLINKDKKNKRPAGNTVYS